MLYIVIKLKDGVIYVIFLIVDKRGFFVGCIIEKNIL